MKKRIFNVVLIMLSLVMSIPVNAGVMDFDIKQNEGFIFNLSTGELTKIERGDQDNYEYDLYFEANQDIKEDGSIDIEGLILFPTALLKIRELGNANIDKITHVPDEGYTCTPFNVQKNYTYAIQFPNGKYGLISFFKLNEKVFVETEVVDEETGETTMEDVLSHTSNSFINKYSEIPFDVLPTDGDIIWEIDSYHESEGTPIIVENNLYIQTMYGLSCYNANNGNQKWSTDANNFGSSSPIYDDGYIYMTTKTDLYKINAGSGAIEGTIDLNENIQTIAPAICGEYIFLATTTRFFSIKKSNMQTAWYKYIKTNDIITDTEKNTVIALSDNINCYDAATGVLNWEVPLNAQKICSDGVNFYVAGNDSKETFLKAFNINNQALVFHQKITGESISSIVVNDKAIYTVMDTELSAFLKADGIEIWKHAVNLEGLKLTVTNDSIFICDGNILCLDSETGSLKWESDNIDPVNGEILLLNNILYAASTNGKIYTIDAGESVSGKWQMVRNNKALSGYSKNGKIEFKTMCSFYFTVKSQGAWQTEVNIINTGYKDLDGTLMLCNRLGVVQKEESISLKPNQIYSIVISDPLVSYLKLTANSRTVVGSSRMFNENSVAISPVLKIISTNEINIPHIAVTEGWKTQITLINTMYFSQDCIIELNNGTEKKISLNAYESRDINLSTLFPGTAFENIKAAKIKNGNGIIGTLSFSKGQMFAVLKLSGPAYGRRLYIPHIAHNRYWTGIGINNPDEYDTDTQITSYSMYGTELSERDLTIGPNESYVESCIEKEASWFEIEAFNCNAFEIFGDKMDTKLAGFSAVNLESKNGMFIVETPNDYISLINISKVAAKVNLTAYDRAGTIISNKLINIIPHQKFIEMPSELFGGINVSHIKFISNQLLVGFKAFTEGNKMGAVPSLPCPNSEDYYASICGMPYISSSSLLQWGCRNRDNFYLVDIYDSEGNILQTKANYGMGVHQHVPDVNRHVIGNYGWKVWSPTGYGNTGFEGTYSISEADNKHDENKKWRRSNIFIDTNNDGINDIEKSYIYEGDKLMRMEMDTNMDGTPDYTKYYYYDSLLNPNPTRIEEDFNGDGVSDSITNFWYKYVGGEFKVWFEWVDSDNDGEIDDKILYSYNFFGMLGMKIFNKSELIITYFYKELPPTIEPDLVEWDSCGDDKSYCLSFYLGEGLLSYPELPICKNNINSIYLSSMGLIGNGSIKYAVGSFSCDEIVSGEAKIKTNFQLAGEILYENKSLLDVVRDEHKWDYRIEYLYEKDKLSEKRMYDNKMDLTSVEKTTYDKYDNPYGLYIDSNADGAIDNVEYTYWEDY